MIRFIELISEAPFSLHSEATAAASFTLSEVWINEKYVIKVAEATRYKRLLQEGHLGPDLDTHHDFTSITTNNGSLSETHVVVGDVTTVAARLNCDKRILLKG